MKEEIEDGEVLPIAVVVPEVEEGNLQELQRNLKRAQEEVESQKVRLKEQEERLQEREEELQRERNKNRDKSKKTFRLRKGWPERGAVLLLLPIIGLYVVWGFNTFQVLPEIGGALNLESNCSFEDLNLSYAVTNVTIEEATAGFQGSIFVVTILTPAVLFFCIGGPYAFLAMFGMASIASVIAYITTITGPGLTTVEEIAAACGRDDIVATVAFMRKLYPGGIVCSLWPVYGFVYFVIYGEVVP